MQDIPEKKSGVFFGLPGFRGKSSAWRDFTRLQKYRLSFFLGPWKKGIDEILSDFGVIGIHFLWSFFSQIKIFSQRITPFLLIKNFSSKFDNWSFWRRQATKAAMVIQSNYRNYRARPGATNVRQQTVHQQAAHQAARKIQQFMRQSKIK